MQPKIQMLSSRQQKEITMDAHTLSKFTHQVEQQLFTHRQNTQMPMLTERLKESLDWA